MKAIRHVPRMITARPLVEAERPAMVAAFLDAGLAVDDLRLPGREFFSFRDPHNTAVGYCGIEVYQESALLRSLMLLPEMRRRGYGAAIIERMAEHARRRGARSLYLLTASSAEYFERAGFQRIDRAEAPPAIAATTEFKALAPTGATFMRRALG